MIAQGYKHPLKKDTYTLMESSAFLTKKAQFDSLIYKILNLLGQ